MIRRISGLTIRQMFHPNSIEHSENKFVGTIICQKKNALQKTRIELKNKMIQL